MDAVYAINAVSITELKKNPTAVVEKSEGTPVVILNHNKPLAYLIPASTYEALMDDLEDRELAKLVKERKGQPRIRVSLDDL